MEGDWHIAGGADEEQRFDNAPLLWSHGKAIERPHRHLRAAEDSDVASDGKWHAIDVVRFAASE